MARRPPYTLMDDGLEPILEMHRTQSHIHYLRMKFSTRGTECTYRWLTFSMSHLWHVIEVGHSYGEMFPQRL
jgi:hypothetical protein